MRGAHWTSQQVVERGQRAAALVRRKRRKESGWEREVVKRHRCAGARRRPTDGTRGKRSRATEERWGEEGAEHDEEKACAKERETERAPEDSSREREAKE